MGLFAVVLTGVFDRARAQPVPDQWHLRVVAPDDAQCVTTDELARWVHARVARDVFTENTSTKQVDVIIERDASSDGFVARVMTRVANEVDGVRELHSDHPRCDALDEALVLVVAGFVGVTEQIVIAEAAPEPPSQRTDQPSRPRQAPALPAAPRVVMTSAMTRAEDPPMAPRRWTLQASVHVQTGLTPRVALGPALGTRLEWGTLSLAAEVAWLPSSQVDLVDGGRAHFSAWLAGMHTCGGTDLAPTVAFRGCLGMLGSAIAASTRGLWRVEDTLRPVLSIAPSVQVSWRLALPLSLRLSVGVSAPIVAQRYFYLGPGGQERTFHTVSVGIWSQLGMAWQLDS